MAGLSKQRNRGGLTRFGPFSICFSPPFSPPYSLHSYHHPARPHRAIIHDGSSFMSLSMRIRQKPSALSYCTVMPSESSLTCRLDDPTVPHESHLAFKMLYGGIRIKVRTMDQSTTRDANDLIHLSRGNLDASAPSHLQSRPKKRRRRGDRPDRPDSTEAGACQAVVGHAGLIDPAAISS